MLVLTRRVGESLMVGDDVTVTVINVKGNQVGVAINASKDLTVRREELIDDDISGNLQAAWSG